MELKDIELKYLTKAKYNKDTNLFESEDELEPVNLCYSVDSKPFFFTLPRNQANYFQTFMTALYEKPKSAEGNEKKKIVMLLSANHTMPSNFVKFFEEFADYNRKFFDIKVLVEVNYIIDEARNNLISRALAMIEKPDYCFFVDVDNTFKANTLIKLVEADKDVISGLYFQRHKPHYPVAFKVGEDKITRFLTEFKFGTIMEVDYVGAGCLLIKREVLEKLSYPYMYVYRNLKSQTTVGEDIVFCQKIKNAGYQIFLHCGTDVGHIGGFNINSRDWQNFYEKKEYIKELETNIIDFENEISKVDCNGEQTTQVKNE